MPYTSYRHFICPLQIVQKKDQWMSPACNSTNELAEHEFEPVTWSNPFPWGKILHGYTLPSAIHFCKFGRISNSTLLLPPPIASWIRHFIDMRIFPVLASRMLPKKEFRAEAKTASGRACLSNFPSMKQPFKSVSGFLIWLTRVDFLHDSRNIRFMERWVMICSISIFTPNSTSRESHSPCPGVSWNGRHHRLVTQHDTGLE